LAAQVAKAVERTDKAIAALRELALSGTTVGTGLNRHPAFAANRTLREVVLDKKLMDAATLDRVLDPLSMTKS
jgi:fumarate hydratase class II